MPAEPFLTSLEHLLAELERLDVLIQARVWQMRQMLAAAGGENLRGFYISEQEIDELLAQPLGQPRWTLLPEASALPQLTEALAQRAAHSAQRAAASAQQGVALRLLDLAQRFGLTPLEVDILLLGLAPELDLRYERLYAYLHDDMNKKRPSVELALNLLCPTLPDKLSARAHFNPQAPLLAQALIQLFDDPTQPAPPLLGKLYKVEERVVSYLLGHDALEAQLQPYATLQLPQKNLPEFVAAPPLQHTLPQLAQQLAADPKPLICYLHGGVGVGKHTVAALLCQAANDKPLLTVDLALLPPGPAVLEPLLRLVYREATLQNAAVYWAHFEKLLADDQTAALRVFLAAAERWPGLTFLASQLAWQPTQVLTGNRFVSLTLPIPSANERAQIWARAMQQKALPPAGFDLPALANKFHFSGGQIHAALATAHNLAYARAPLAPQVTPADLSLACRLQSNRKLHELARKITPQAGWGDLVLPPAQLEQLQEVRAAVKQRAHVYEAWGFAHKLVRGQGLNILFAGPSGTGKTLAAEIIAGELGLDLYQIDLSTLVSKYIGETEKNLARIFAEAETSNAILFFDEADALFGKRTEVRDAHDRYANIETSYLLQQMEAYRGVVILATNLRKNMDEAFVRRLHYSVEFPWPGAGERQRIWERIWPTATPCSADLDWAALARNIDVAGGNIRNIALAAAFLAAEDGGVVALPHILRATRREYQKMGKVLTGKELTF